MMTKQTGKDYVWFIVKTHDFVITRNPVCYCTKLSPAFSKLYAFVLKEIMKGLRGSPAHVFGVAFGPGLTMETFIASEE